MRPGDWRTLTLRCPATLLRRSEASASRRREPGLEGSAATGALYPDGRFEAPSGSRPGSHVSV